jgi:hypothetical protein
MPLFSLAGEGKAADQCDAFGAGKMSEAGLDLAIALHQETEAKNKALWAANSPSKKNLPPLSPAKKKGAQPLLKSLPASPKRAGARKVEKILRRRLVRYPRISFLFSFLLSFFLFHFFPRCLLLILCGCDFAVLIFAHS